MFPSRTSQQHRLSVSPIAATISSPDIHITMTAADADQTAVTDVKKETVVPDPNLGFKIVSQIEVSVTDTHMCSICL